MKVKRAAKKKGNVSESESDSEYNSDEELQEAFAKGLLKPGLNVVIEENKKQHKNYVNLMKEKLEEIKLQLPWIERLDMVNVPAPLAPELALQMQEQEVRRANQLKGNRKLPQYDPSEDPVLNDFRRETMFHRQAQGAVLDGIARIKKLGISTRRPDDYFAEMAKTDEHMQKVRENLAKKQIVAQRSEKIRQLRAQKKVSKQMQVESTLKKHAEKRKLLEEVKKYRKGVRRDLDFLDNKKSHPKPGGKKGKSRALERRQMRDTKYGFGGKKRGGKRNTSASSADVSEYRGPSKPGQRFNQRGTKGGAMGGMKGGMKGGPKGRMKGGPKGGSKTKSRLGKNRRTQMKAKKRRQ